MAQGTSLENFEKVGNFYFPIDKPALPDRLTCKHCKKFSGYKRSTLYCLKKGRELKCKNCDQLILKHI